MQLTFAFFTLAVAQGIAAISLHPRGFGTCDATACAASATEQTGPLHCCPVLADAAQLECQSVYTPCPGATCNPGTEYTITCSGTDHCCPTKDADGVIGAHCQPNGELCGIIWD